MADVEIEFLTEGDVEAAAAFADGGGEGAFDGDAVLVDGVECFLGQPVVVAIEVSGFFAGVDFEPLDVAGAVVGLLDEGVEGAFHGEGDFGADAVACDEGDDGVVGDVQFAVGVDFDGGAVGGVFNF